MIFHLARGRKFSGEQ